MNIRQTGVWFAALLLFSLAPIPATAVESLDGLPAAAVKMKNIDEKLVSIADVRGDKGTLVVFTCNHCPYVKAWENRMAALGNEFNDKGVGVIFINSNDPSVYPDDGFTEMQQRARNKGFGFPYVVDTGSAAARAFEASRTPEAFLFDREGKLVYHGAVDDNAQDSEAVKQRYLRDALSAILAGDQVDPGETKSIGCSIKFYPEEKTASAQ